MKKGLCIKMKKMAIILMSCLFLLTVAQRAGAAGDSSAAVSSGETERVPKTDGGALVSVIVLFGMSASTMLFCMKHRTRADR